MQMAGNLPEADEWRIHFHVPLHASPGGDMGDTRLHVIDTLFWLSKNPNACRHLEMETYTWEVLPEKLQAGTVVEQVGKEYQWTLEQMDKIGFSLEKKTSPPFSDAVDFTPRPHSFPGIQSTHGLDKLSGRMGNQSISRKNRWENSSMA